MEGVEGINSKSEAEKPHVLIIDDDSRICSLVSRYLEENGFLAMTAPDTSEAKETLKRMVFDALVVDIMMPGENGLDFTQSLRDAGNDIPVILLTALGEVDDRVIGLQTGADDYLPKPFDPRELVLRLQSILKRRPKDTKKTPVSLKIGPWIYNPDQNDLCNEIDGAVQRLTTVEGNLLRAFSMYPGVVISREDLAELCDMESSERAIDVQVTRLRRKIEEDSKVPRYLHTVRGKGYVLRAESL